MTIASPFTLRDGLTFKNRIAKAAMTEGLAGADRLPNEHHVRLYRRWAAGTSACPSPATSRSTASISNAPAMSSSTGH